MKCSERIEPSLRHVGIGGEIPAGTEQAVGVAPFARAVPDVVAQRVDAARRHVGIGFQIPGANRTGRTQRITAVARLRAIEVQPDAQTGQQSGTRDPFNEDLRPASRSARDRSTTEITTEIRDAVN